MYETVINPVAKSNPGIAPAIKSLATERPVKVPATIMGRLGGIMGPIVDDDAVIARENSVS